MNKTNAISKDVKNVAGLLAAMPKAGNESVIVRCSNGTLVKQCPVIVSDGGLVLK